MSEMQDLLSLENLERQLEDFSHLLEKSSEKERNAMHKLNQQMVQINNLSKENQFLREDNDRLKDAIEKSLLKIQKYMESASKKQDFEKENTLLRTKLNNLITENHEKTVDLEIDKEKYRKENIELKETIKQLTESNSSLLKKFESINLHIHESFEKSLTHANTLRIEELEIAIKEKEEELKDFKLKSDKIKEELENKMKKLRMEYDLLSMDYRCTLTDNLKKQNGSINRLGAEKAVFENDNNDKEETKAPVGRRTRKIALKNQKKNDDSMMQIEDEQDDSNEGSDKKNGNKAANKSDIEIEDEDEYNPSDYEAAPTNTKKRKAANNRKKPETKRVRKNENKEFLLANKNTILYHLNH
jgi:hypothetical protein